MNSSGNNPLAKCHLIPILLLIVTLGIAYPSDAQNAYVYSQGTCWEPAFYDIIKPRDPSSFQRVTFETEKNAEMWDREANNNNGAWITPICWIFKLAYDDGITAEIRVRQSGFTKEQATTLANQYGRQMGQLPACLRKGTAFINIMKGNGLFGGNNSLRSIDITIGENSELYHKTGNMEEVLFHEATHAALDYLYDRDWKVHRNRDPKFISTYAAENPDSEDISESFMLFAALRHRKNRIAAEASKIQTNIANRLRYYERLSLDMYPFNKNSTKETSSLFDDNAFYRLTTQWQGDGKSLDILNDGKNNQPILTQTADVSGQMWKITKVGTDTYVLSTAWLGTNRVLTCLKGANQNRPMLHQSSGQLRAIWKITSVGNGFFRITNMGINRSLDIINDGTNDKIQVSVLRNYSGQLWKITKLE